MRREVKQISLCERMKRANQKAPCQMEYVCSLIDKLGNMSIKEYLTGELFKECYKELAMILESRGEDPVSMTYMDLAVLLHIWYTSEEPDKRRDTAIVLSDIATPLVVNYKRRKKNFMAYIAVNPLYIMPAQYFFQGAGMLARNVFLLWHYHNEIRFERKAGYGEAYEESDVDLDNEYDENLDDRYDEDLLELVGIYSGADEKKQITDVEMIYRLLVEPFYAIAAYRQEERKG